MEVTLQYTGEGLHFQATGSTPHRVDLDAAEAVGGRNMGARPMELLLMGLGGCSAFDMLLILKKQRQQVDGFDVRITGERVQVAGTEMKPFRKIHIEYLLRGPIDRPKAERAAALSMEKYCSATAQLACSAEITHTVTLL